DVHPRSALLDPPLVLLRETPGDHDPQIRMAILQGFQMSEVAVELVVCVLTDGARIQHDHPRLVDRVGRRHALRHQHAADPLRVVLVHRAPEGADQVLRPHRLSGYPPQRAYSVARVSRTTVILICPGYWSSSSTCFAMSRAITCAERSSTESGCTRTRTSLPACIA